MNREELTERRHALLENLCDELNRAEVAAVIRQEEGAPEMVSALLDDLGGGDLEDILGDFS